MEDIYSPCERDEETGQVLDPIYYTPIPEDRLIVVREGSGVWCMDALALLKNMVLYRNTTNPLTRSQLSDSVLRQVGNYRLEQVKSVVVVNEEVDPASDKRTETFIFDSFDLVGDIYSRIALESKVGYNIASLTLELDGESLYSADLDSDLAEYKPIVVVHARNGTLTKSEYERINAFVGKYDRYKWKFSPFPVAGTSAGAPTVSYVQPSPLEYLHSIVRERSARSSAFYREEAYPPPEPPQWLPAPWGRSDRDGRWMGWTLYQSRYDEYPPDYNGGAMREDTISVINTYNSTLEHPPGSELDKFGSYAAYLVGQRLPLAPPVIARSDYTPTLDYPIDQLAWFPGYGHRMRDGPLGRETTYAWSGWKLMPINAAYTNPPSYNGEGMPEKLVSSVLAYNQSGSRGYLDLYTRGNIEKRRVQQGQPLPPPVPLQLEHYPVRTLY